MSITLPDWATDEEAIDSLIFSGPIAFAERCLGYKAGGLVLTKEMETGMIHAAMLAHCKGLVDAGLTGAQAMAVFDDADGEPKDFTVTWLWKDGELSCTIDFTATEGTS